ncbi:hypothetical protein HLB44_30840 [Aquincola sp. S2]|uniref:Uncharacterized protein n=1 Tax=Pseudaquabacterium terrae TaxID=2732868 RepID=A0ABX2ERY4_9BURK|nr:hypothetical protein [Aquabacterium terrae]NRF71391.1 hypothetical protein [Aquabacterium terrae]
MQYIVVLDGNTPVGRIYASDNDGFVKDNERSHPVLRCLSVDHTNQSYVLLTRAGQKQTFYVPHPSVVAIYRVEGDDGLPTGFSQLPEEQ